jgi:multisubunit Na+/H+ antiporter MnhE subunit
MKNAVYATILLTAVWLILVEKITLPLLAVGIFVSAGSLYVYHRFLPFPKITGISLFRLTLYPFYLIGKLYLSAFKAIKLIVSGADVDVIEVKTEISNSFLQTMLANSVTLIPGATSLELKDGIITVLLLKKKTNNHEETKKAGEAMIHKLENFLLKAQR